MNSTALQDILNNYRGKQLFVAIHAPQGCGKTTLSEYLYNSLSNRGYNVLVISLDDFYYPYDIMKTKLNQFDHEMYKYRGLAGTHDIYNLNECFRKLKYGKHTYIPIFNKSLREGFGDVEKYKYVQKKMDIIIFEGWMIGYSPQAFVDEKLILFNNELKKYKFIQDFFDLWICFDTDNIDNIYKWRWSAEQNFDENEFKAFMNPYMEVYKNYICKRKNTYILDINRNII